MAAQLCYFDPKQPFKRRLFDNQYQKNTIKKKKNWQEDQNSGISAEFKK